MSRPGSRARTIAASIVHVTTLVTSSAVLGVVVVFGAVPYVMMRSISEPATTALAVALSKFPLLNALSRFAVAALKRHPLWGPRMRAHFNRLTIRESSRLSIPPGSTLNGFARWLFSPRTYDHVLQPVLADLQAEYFEALREGRPYKAKWVRARGYCRFWSHVGAQLPVSVLRAAVKLWFSIP